MSKSPDITSLGIPRKGAAAPAEQKEVPELARAPTLPPTRTPEDPRTTVSTRLTVSVQKRLRRCAYETEQEKQTIIEEALDKHLRSLGF